MAHEYAYDDDIVNLEKELMRNRNVIYQRNDVSIYIYEYDNHYHYS